MSIFNTLKDGDISSVDETSGDVVFAFYCVSRKSDKNICHTFDILVICPYQYNEKIKSDQRIYFYFLMKTSHINKVIKYHS